MEISFHCGAERKPQRAFRTQTDTAQTANTLFVGSSVMHGVHRTIYFAYFTIITLRRARNFYAHPAAPRGKKIGKRIFEKKRVIYASEYYIEECSKEHNVFYDGEYIVNLI